MTESRFVLTLVVLKGDTKRLEEVILETPPDEVHFAHQFKALKVVDDRLIVTSKGPSPLVEVSLSELS